MLGKQHVVKELSEFMESQSVSPTVAIVLEQRILIVSICFTIVWKTQINKL